MDEGKSGSEYISMPSNDNDVEAMYKYLSSHFVDKGLSSKCFHYLERLYSFADMYLKEVE